jgi:hypothetical protein
MIAPPHPEPVVSATCTARVDPDTPTVVDVEASGFGAGSYPIEVGVVLPDGRTHCTLIRPASDWTHWDPGAEAVHHIPRGILHARGKAPEEVAVMLNEWLSGRVAYSDAWGQDRSWLARLFDEAGIAQRFRLESMRALLSDAQVERWNGARAEVLAEIGVPRHRASADALIVQRTWQRSRLPAPAA